MNGKLTTHVLDTARGRPASGVTIELWRAGGKIKECQTNVDGRTDEPLLSGADMKSGCYELVFVVGAYFAAGESAFLDRIPVRFTITDASQHYHIPLLASPWAYSTYRGS